MKPLVPAVLALILCSAAPLRAQVAEVSDPLKELKKKYANGGQKPEAPREPEAPPAAARPRDESAPMFKSGLMPALYARSAKGPDGYSLGALTDNLKWTEKNLSALVDYIHPWQKGVEAPSGEANAAAHKMLAAESAAAAALIVDADAALAKGIPRDPKDPNPLGLPRMIGYLSRASYAYRDPTPDQRLETRSSLQANVLGHMGALIEFKRLNPPDAEGEAKTEGWLENARKQLASADGEKKP
jgi:hypothetical protein